MQINVLDYFKKTANAAPEKCAVIEGKNRISFRELKDQAQTLAVEIINFDLFNKPIAVYLPKSINSIIADIAITYSGNFYMNLDVKTPSARIRNIIELIKPELIITTKILASDIILIDEKLKLIVIDEINFIKFIESDLSNLINLRLKKIVDTDPLCIINTSGSTGTPKGVVLNHKSFINFTQWAIETLKIREDEIVGSLSPIVFDIYSFELCMLMARGSTLVLLPDSLSPFPAKLLEFMKINDVTFIFWVPTIMVNIAKMDLLAKIPLPELKTVWFAGEVFPTKQFNYWRKHLSNVTFVNLYGPIEITLDCTYFIVDRHIEDDEPIPIGFPCRNTDVLILNEKNHLVSVYEEGELCVRGTSLAMGYYNNLPKTTLAFVQNPLHTAYPETIYRTGDIVFINDAGEIIFKGRKDRLVKHFGYRIDLSEVEHVIINTLNLVDNGCVIYNSNKKEITFFFESKNTISARKIKEAVGKVFPKYMIPTAIYQMDEMPRSTNGKIDRLQLNNIINNE